jgi:hypothetical protein
VNTAHRSMILCGNEERQPTEYRKSQGSGAEKSAVRPWLFVSVWLFSLKIRGSGIRFVFQYRTNVVSFSIGRNGKRKSPDSTSLMKSIWA